MCKPKRKRKTVFRFRVRFLQKNRTLCPHENEKASFFFVFRFRVGKKRFQNEKQAPFSCWKINENENEKRHLDDDNSNSTEIIDTKYTYWQ